MKKILAIIVHEIREAIPAFLFLLLVLGLARVTMALVLESYHVGVHATAVVVIGALILAKAILVADALPLTRIFADRALVLSALWKTLIYGVITFAFRFLEEFIPLAHRYGGITAAWDRLLEEVSWPHFWAVQIWITFSLLCYSLGVEVVRALGREKIMALLFGAGPRVR
ncbi:MAG TPA: hypothetical protein VFP70_07880 [Burkholderiales bacterium]|nr:hypothetical protein [Burkholderiales bacterium]